MARDYVYVEDVARANLLALEKGAGEAVNVATARDVRTRELLAAICRITGKELKYTRGGPGRATSARAASTTRKRPAFSGGNPASASTKASAGPFLVQRDSCLTPASRRSGSSPAPGGMEFAQAIYSHLETITAEKMEERAQR